MKMLKLSLAGLGAIVASFFVVATAFGATTPATWKSSTEITVTSSNKVYTTTDNTNFYPPEWVSTANFSGSGQAICARDMGLTFIKKSGNTYQLITVTKDPSPRVAGSCLLPVTFDLALGSQPSFPAVSGVFTSSTAIVLSDGHRYSSLTDNGASYFLDGKALTPTCSDKITSISSNRKTASLYKFTGDVGHNQQVDCGASQFNAMYTKTNVVNLDATLATTSYKWISASTIKKADNSTTYTKQTDGTFEDTSNLNGCGDIIAVTGTIDITKLTNAKYTTVKDNTTARSGKTCKSGASVSIKVAPVDPTDPQVLAAAAGNTSPDAQCDGGGLTYIICPIVLGAAGTVDELKKLLQQLLQVKPLTTATTGNSVYTIWSNIRNFADILFVLVFLVVIFGTSIGLDNYTVKKTLPRLVAAAILVQISYFLTAFVIDIGNILGGGMDALAYAAGVGKPVFDFTSTTGTLLVVLGGGALIAGAAIALTFTAVISAFIAMLVLIMTLEIRQVIILVLIILSPLAMVAWVLPNTDKLFKLWYKSLFQMIMLYPIIMLLFIGGSLFATVVMSTNLPFKEALSIIAYVVPLLMVPAVFKASGTLFNMASKGVGSIGQRAEKSFGAGSAGDKRRTENRVAKQAPKALDQTRNPLSRAISSKKAGFGYLPSANQKTMMAGVVKKQEAADFEAAAKPLAGLDSTQVLAKMGEAGATDLTKRAAVARLAELGAHDQLAKALTNHYGGNTSDENWQKATASKASDLAKVAPHLTMGSDAATDTYKKMSAEQVAALSEDGFKQWSQRVSTDRVAEIGQQFASSPPLQSKTNDVRRAILNSATGSTPGRSDYVPSPQEVAVGNAYTDAHAINDSMNVAATATTTARSNVQGYLNDSTRSGTTPADHADIHSTYATNDLYKQAVDHAIITGSTVPKPFHNDPLAQGEVKIPGDDRSVS